MSGADHTPWLMLKMENPEKILARLAKKVKTLVVALCPSLWVRFP
jgi:hypothetical protein